MARSPGPALSRHSMLASSTQQEFLHQSRRKFLLTWLGAAGFLALPVALRAAEPAQSQLAALAFDGDALLAAGPNLIRSDDGSRSWTDLPAIAGVLALATHPNRPGRAVAGLSSGGVAVSEDGGRTWESRAGGIGKGAVDAVTIAAGQPDIIYAAVRGDGLWKSEDAGRSWTLAMDRPWLDGAECNLTALASVNLESGMGGIWIYAGSEAGLTRVPDCFCRWQDVQPGNAMDALVSGDVPPSEAPLPEGEPVHALASAPSAPETLYAALPSGIWTSRDGGVVWSHLADGIASAVAVHPVNSDHIAAALEGGLKQSRDGGITWSALAAI